MIRHAVKLMASGFFAAIGFILFAKGVFFDVEQNVVNSFFSLLAIQLLVVTAGVLGADRKVISVLSALSVMEGRRGIEISRGFYTWLGVVVFFAIVFLVLFYKVGYFLAFLVVASGFFDAISVIKQARFSAQLETNKLLVLSLARYPVFFILIWCGGFFGVASVEVLWLLFLFLAVFRFLIIVFFERSVTKDVFLVGPDFFLGGHQVFNYIVNRGGQIIIGISLLNIDQDVQGYFFLSWKIIEFVDKLVITLVPILFSVGAGLCAKKSVFLVLVVSAVSSSLFLGLSFVFGGSSLELGFVCMLGFVLHAFLIYPSNVELMLFLRESGGGWAFFSVVIGLMVSFLCLLLFWLLEWMLAGVAFFTPIGLLTMVVFLKYGRGTVRGGASC